MFLFRTLSVPGSVAKKAPIILPVLFPLLAQGCTVISGLSQRNDQSLTLPQASNDITPSGANIQKVSVEPDSRKKSAKPPVAKHALNGTASWYGPRFHGKKTASGEIYDQSKFTAAHKTLPLGTKARVTNLDNGSAVEVEINDRGPFVEGRIIDLSRAAAGALGFVESGTAPVQVKLIAEETASNN
jgi:rare lipoprotein A (peptidoglycan hydrolase)